jgi:SAM-dependent methyltransferase
MEALHWQAGRAVGLDPDLASLRRHRLSAFDRACGLAEHLPFPGGSFDLVCCSWVLEHVARPGEVFDEVARVLAPGGHFIFVTPNRRHPLLTLNRVLGWTRGWLVARLYGRRPTDTFAAFYRANTVSDLERWAHGAGLRAVGLVRVGDPTYLAFGELLYRVACLLERLIPADRRVHLVGDYVRNDRPLSPLGDSGGL